MRPASRAMSKITILSEIHTTVLYFDAVFRLQVLACLLMTWIIAENSILHLLWIRNDSGSTSSLGFVQP